MNRTRDELAAAAIPPVKVPLWTRDYMLACCANLMMGLAFFELVPVLPLYLTGQLQVSSGWLGWIMSIYVLAAILSRPWFAHRVVPETAKRFTSRFTSCWPCPFPDTPLPPRP